MTDPRPQEEEIGSHYPAGYYAHGSRRSRLWSGFASRLKDFRGGYPNSDSLPVQLILRLLARTLGAVFLTSLPYAGPGRRLLDVGCGSGSTLLWAKERGWDVYGVEPDLAAVQNARARGLTEVKHGHLREQDFPAESFDVVTLYQVLEHSHSPRHLLAECRRILKPQGLLYLTVPNFESWGRVLLGSAWNAFQIPLHLHHFSLPGLRRLAEETGYEVMGVRYYSRILTLVYTARDLPAAIWNPSARKGIAARLRSALSTAGEARTTDVFLLALKPKPPFIGNDSAGMGSFLTQISMRNGWTECVGCDGRAF